MSDTCGLVLCGGGARAAYQVGVLRAIAEVTEQATPCRILTGVSAGAVNACFLAARATDFAHATRELWELWANLRIDDVFRTDAGTVSEIGAGWLFDLVLGGAFQGSRSTFLLDTQPLRQRIASAIDFAALRGHVASGHLHAVALTATCYNSGSAITFYDAAVPIAPWQRSHRQARAAELSTDHVLSSAAIPVLFPPVRIDDGWYGDGGIRMTAPLSPPVHLGADRVLAIGIAQPRPRQPPEGPGAGSTSRAFGAPNGGITLAEMAGVLLNALFLDTLDADAERMARINQTLALMSAAQLANHPQGLRRVPLMVVRPSQDLGQLAAEEFHRLPRVLRYLLRGIGASERTGWDLLSYLSFDGGYTRPLLALGYRDGVAQANAIVRFLGEERPGLRPMAM
jgi:NTE family protein